MVRWVDSYIDQEGWLPAGGANRVAWFVSSLPNPGTTYPLVQDWVRGEYASEQETRSFVWRLEADCATGRRRVHESYHYKNNNLRGFFAEGNGNGGKWEDTVKGSVMQSIVDTICRGARP